MSYFKKQYSEEDYDWDNFQSPQSSKNINTENSSTFSDYSSTSNLGNSNSRNETSFSQQNSYQNQQNPYQNPYQNQLPVAPNRMPSNFSVQTNYSTKWGGLVGLFENLFNLVDQHRFVSGFFFGQIFMFIVLTFLPATQTNYFSVFYVCKELFSESI